MKTYITTEAISTGAIRSYDKYSTLLMDLRYFTNSGMPFKEDRIIRAIFEYSKIVPNKTFDIEYNGLKICFISIE